MSLRSTILKAAIPHLSRTSFTRVALSTALESLPQSNPDHRPRLNDSTIDTLFGQGRAAPRALVNAWEEAGIEAMAGNENSGKLYDILARRLQWSATVGEHLVEAYALLASSSSSALPSVPVPTNLLTALSHLSPALPPLYRPFATAASAAAASEPVSRLLESTGGNLPLPRVNPAAPLAYAWRIADAAMYAARPHKGSVGVMREDAGAGVEWYTSRVGLAMAYLASEALLLQPQPTSFDKSQTNPSLPDALNALGRHLRRLDEAKGYANSLENGANTVISLLELSTRSIAGIIRSRGF